MVRPHLSRTVIVALAAVLLPFGIGLGQTQASTTSATRTPYTHQTAIYGSQVRLRSSTGKLLYVSVEADTFSQRPFTRYPPSASLDVSLSDRQGESHDWEFDQVNDKTVTYNSKTGEGTVEAGGAEVAPFGHMRLTIAPLGASRVHTCANGATRTLRSVSFGGLLLFRTHSKAWGSVGSATKSLRFTGKSTVEIDNGRLANGCLDGGGPLRCAGGLGFQSPGSWHGLFFATTNWRRQKHPFIDFTTSHSVGKNFDAQLETDAFVVQGSLHVATAPDGSVVATLHTGATGLVTGSATLTSTGPPKHYGKPCSGSRARTWPASYTNGANPLTVHPEIGRTFSPRNAKTGAFISQDPR